MAKLDEIYKKIPNIKCKGLCHGSCNFIVIGKKEKTRLENSGIHGNFVLREDFDQTVEISGLERKCSMLSDCGKCTIYNERPFICRLFGTVKKMACPFGCKPDRWLTDSQAKKLMNKVGM